MNEVELGVVAFVLVATISVAYGIACTLVARKLANHDVIRTAGRRFVAHLLELRLFMDDPVLLLGSQRNLIAAYAALLRALVLPALAVVILSVPLLYALQNWFAKAPLPLNCPAVITVHLQRMFDVSLTTPSEVRIDTDAVRVLELHPSVDTKSARKNWEHSVFVVSLTSLASGRWEVWESRRDFQGLRKLRETWGWFSEVSISAVTFHRLQ